MAKPGDIPQDVWDAALGWTVPGSGSRLAVVARAILAERERCRHVAREALAAMTPAERELLDLCDDVITTAIRSNDVTNHSKFPSRAEGKTA